MNVIAPQKHLFNVADFYQLTAQFFQTDCHLELIEGEVIDMAPIGNQHAFCVDRLAYFFITQVQEAAVVRIQGPIQLSDFSEPQPDLALLRPHPTYYRQTIPTALDILLLVEVAYSSLEYDKEIKLPLYACHGIKEVWIVDVENNQVEIYTFPQTQGYLNQSYLRRRQYLVPSQLTQVKIPVSALF